MDLARCYEVLGVRRGASDGEVRDAYRALVKQWHPDRFADDPERQRQAERRLAEINEAFARVRDAPPEAEASSDRGTASSAKDASHEFATAEQTRARRKAVREQAERARAIAANLRRRWLKELLPTFAAGVAGLGAAIVAGVLAPTWMAWPPAAIAVLAAGATAWLGRRSARRYRDLTEQLRGSDYAMRCPHCRTPATHTLLSAPGALDRLAQSGSCERCGRSHFLR